MFVVDYQAVFIDTVRKNIKKVLRVLGEHALAHGGGGGGKRACTLTADM
jgi:hypothetical protein